MCPHVSNVHKYVFNGSHKNHSRQSLLYIETWEHILQKNAFYVYVRDERQGLLCMETWEHILQENTCYAKFHMSIYFTQACIERENSDKYVWDNDVCSEFSDVCSEFSDEIY